MAHQPKAPRLPPAIRATLSGADWHWVNGSKHWKLYVGGRMVGVWSKSTRSNATTSNPRLLRNAHAQIRSAVGRKKT